ncbi:MAG TPA: SMR family transporter [Candidatus Paceibacterota bacterium]
MLLGWILLSIAIIAEVAGTLAIGLSQGFTKKPIVALFVVFPGYATSLICLILIMRWELMNLSVAYALWVALGVALVAVVSSLMGEPMPPLKIFFIIILVIGAVGLQLADAHR